MHENYHEILLIMPEGILITDKNFNGVEFSNYQALNYLGNPKPLLPIAPISKDLEI
jgi:hypothetical protein